MSALSSPVPDNAAELRSSAVAPLNAVDATAPSPPAKAVVVTQADQVPNDLIKVPHLSLWRLFLVFLEFGVLAWGGPVAQIAMIKQKLVVEDKWITVARFNRVLAVYQVLPGPEAAELCCYFGMLSRGRLGSVIAGVAFILPGFLMLLGMSALYKQYDLFKVDRFFVSLTAMQATVAALIVRAVHRIGEHALRDHKTKAISPDLAVICILGFPLVIMRLNFFLILIFSGALAWLVSAPVLRTRTVRLLAATALTAAVYAAMIGYLATQGMPSEETRVAGLHSHRNYGDLFIVGLLGGSVTFGGAYTAIPFVRGEAVFNDAHTTGWMTDEQFLDGLALGAIIPSPLVMFVTFVGYLARAVPGALLMTIGMFIPCFAFTFIGHDIFEYVVHLQSVHAILDGFTVGVVTLIAITAIELVKSSVTDTLHVVVFFASLIAIYKFQHRYASILIIYMSAIAGQVFFA